MGELLTTMMRDGEKNSVDYLNIRTLAVFES